MLAKLNLSRGMLRLWVVLTAAWVLFVGALAWSDVSTAAAGYWQYDVETKPGAKPWEIFDGAKAYDEVFARPGDAKLPPKFSKIEYRYVKSFDDAMNAGLQTRISFPDDSYLYMRAAFTKAEHDTVSAWFWERRWGRRWDALSARPELLGFAVGVPLALLLLGFVVRWVVSGFRLA